MMLETLESLDEKKRMRSRQDRKTHLINELYKMDIYETRDGRNFEECTLFTLEHVHVNEKCRAAHAYGES